MESKFNTISDEHTKNEMNHYIEMFLQIPHADRDEIGKWLSDWMNYRSVEAYNRLSEQYIKKAIAVSCEQWASDLI